MDLVWVAFAVVVQRSSKANIHFICTPLTDLADAEVPVVTVNKAQAEVVAPLLSGLLVTGMTSELLSKCIS